MTIKNDAKFDEELTYRFKTDMGNLTNFDPVLENLGTLHFHGVLLNRVYNV